MCNAVLVPPSGAVPVTFGYNVTLSWTNISMRFKLGNYFDKTYASLDTQNNTCTLMEFGAYRSQNTKNKCFFLVFNGLPRSY